MAETGVTPLRAPFPAFGGKATVADVIWEALGNPAHYIEPFANSAAVLLARPHAPGLETLNDIDHYICVGPDTPILGADLRWHAAGDLVPGDDLLAFDENNPGVAREGLRAPTAYRKWRYAQVTHAPRVLLPSYRLLFDDGTEVIASENHCWLAGSHVTGSGGRGWRWVQTKNMVCNRKTQRSWVLKLLPVVHQEESWDAGWIAGMLDGEGSLVGSRGGKIVLAQNPGPILDLARALLQKRGYNIVVASNGKKCQRIHIMGGYREVLRCLMQFRPQRLLPKVPDLVIQRSIYAREHQSVALVEKEYLGPREVIALSTTSHTFIAAGLASHNCNFWRAAQADPDAVAQWADWPVHEADLHARHQWLINQPEWHERMITDPDYYDAKIAGWWLWGISAWIGGGWCAGAVQNRLPHLSSHGKGVHRKRPHLHRYGHGIHSQGIHLFDMMHALCARLRRVRICCGDWQRVCTPVVLSALDTQTLGIFLDPPYTMGLRDKNVYAVDTDPASAVAAWARSIQDRPNTRIVLAGYIGEHEMPGWRIVQWKANGGYGNQGSGRGKANAHKECLWFSPQCVTGQLPLL